MTEGERIAEEMDGAPRADLGRRIDAALAEERKRVIAEWALTHTLTRDEAWEKILDATTARAKAEGAEAMRERCATMIANRRHLHRDEVVAAIRALDAGGLAARRG